MFHQREQLFGLGFVFALLLLFVKTTGDEGSSGHSCPAVEHARINITTSTTVVLNCTWRIDCPEGLAALAVVVEGTLGGGDSLALASSNEQRRQFSDAGRLSVSVTLHPPISINLLTGVTDQTTNITVSLLCFAKFPYEELVEDEDDESGNGTSRTASALTPGDDDDDANEGKAEPSVTAVQQGAPQLSDSQVRLFEVLSLAAAAVNAVALGRVDDVQIAVALATGSCSGETTLGSASTEDGSVALLVRPLAFAPPPIGGVMGTAVVLLGALLVHAGLVGVTTRTANVTVRAAMTRCFFPSATVVVMRFFLVGLTHSVADAILQASASQNRVVDVIISVILLGMLAGLLYVPKRLVANMLTARFADYGEALEWAPAGIRRFALPVGRWQPRAVVRSQGAFFAAFTPASMWFSNVPSIIAVLSGVLLAVDFSSLGACQVLAWAVALSQLALAILTAAMQPFRVPPNNWTAALRSLATALVAADLVQVPALQPIAVPSVVLLPCTALAGGAIELLLLGVEELRWAPKQDEADLKKESASSTKDEEELGEVLLVQALQADEERFARARIVPLLLLDGRSGQEPQES